jgi:formiminotetrahydrofolate cyclodeaminase
VEQTVYPDHSVRTFLDELASPDPVPGGGSAAAVAGALAAGLVSMVCRLTVNRRRFEAATPLLAGVLAQSEEIRQRLTELAQQDTEVYGTVMAAYRLPSGSDDERNARDVTRERALQQAALVPLEAAELCRRIVTLALAAGQSGNPRVVSDAGVAALLAAAALRSALLSVEINVKGIRDAAFAAGLVRRMEAALDGLDATRDSALAAVRERMGA